MGTVEKVLNIVQIGELVFVHIQIPFSSGSMSHYRCVRGRGDRRTRANVIPEKGNDGASEQPRIKV